MSSIKPITLHGHPGPNPWKVAILLEELRVPYTTKIRTTPELKRPDFLAINRNGSSPVIEDPNTNVLLAESGAIMEYIIDQYDTEKRLSFDLIQDQYLMKQWLQFQTTTQGPTLQHIFHWGPVFGTPNPAARAGYVEDFRRVLKVLDDELNERGGWLVGGKCSAADLSFVPFHSRMDFIMAADKPHDMSAECPHVDAWYKEMVQRKAVKKVMTDHQIALKSVVFPTAK